MSLTDVDADEAPPLEDRMYEAEYPEEEEEGMVEERSAGVEQVENRCNSNYALKQFAFIFLVATFGRFS